MLNKCCNFSRMALGKRIQARLDELGWDRKDLLEKVDGLTPQALSNLIVRDSKRSEWDEKIADALGVSVMFLVYGKPPVAYQQPTQQATRMEAREPAAMPDTIRQIMLHVENMSQQGQWELLGQARLLERIHPNVRRQGVQ